MIITIRDGGGMTCYEVNQEYGIDFLGGLVYWTELENGEDHQTPVDNIVSIMMAR